MADVTSREVIDFIREKEFKYGLNQIDDLEIDTIIKLYEEFNKGSSASNLKAKIDIDCSDALKGLKAVQREAKETMKALKEVDALLKSKCPNCNTYSLKTTTVRADNKTVANSTKCVNCDWSDHS